jgi:hypothetical protein
LEKCEKVKKNFMWYENEKKSEFLIHEMNVKKVWMDIQMLNISDFLVKKMLKSRCKNDGKNIMK